ncbi:MAG: cell division protein ZapA [Alphaproteobacteria bacterium]
MAQVMVSINGRSFPVQCDDGEEERLTDLARYVDQHVSDLAQKIGQVGDARLLLMASLVLADELADAVTRLDDAEENAGVSAEMTDLVDTATARIDQLAQRLASA